MKKIVSIMFIMLWLPQMVAATTPTVRLPVNSSPETAFEKKFQVSKVSVMVPTVLEVPLPEPVATGEQFLVYEHETGLYYEGYLRQEQTAMVTMKGNSVPPTNITSLFDGHLNTFTNFPVPNEGVGKVTLSVNTSLPITTTQLTLRLGQYVALPLTVEVRAKELGGVEYQTVVNKTTLTGNAVFFPETTASEFEVSFSYIQPLRIAELQFIEKRPTVERSQFLRFLAQPAYSYTVYYSADRYSKSIITETGDLRRDEGVVSTEIDSFGVNPLYQPADVDADGVIDSLDNCVNDQNALQEDVDGNGRGDVCDDWDRDGVNNGLDNCLTQPNRDQKDTDVDGVGDVCDTEESRFTERNPWIPWVGMGMAGMVLLVLFFLVAKRPDPSLVTEEE